MNLWPFKRGASGEAKSLTPYSAASLGQLLSGVFGGGAAKSGATVTTDTALQVSAVLCCVRVIAEGVAQVPWRVMQEKPSGTSTGVTRLPVTQHALYPLLHRKPNRWQTSFEFRETMIFHILLGRPGVAYAFISRSGGKVIELVLLDPNRVTEKADDFGEFTFEVRAKNGATRTLRSDDVWRIPGPSWTGTQALPLLNLAREAIGLAMATEETQSKLHANGMRPSGAYSVDGNLTVQQYKDLKEWIGREFGGAANTGAPLILDRNAKWNPATMTGVDAQHLETRRHQVEEVCRALRVLPIMAMQSDKASTYASVEQMLIAHLVHTLLPWYERLEQSVDCKLLTDQERAQGIYTLLDPSGMLRGALKDTAEFLTKLVDRGIMVRNEARGYLDLNPLDGLNVPLTPLNMVTSPSNEPEA